MHSSRDMIDHILTLDALECDKIEFCNAYIEWAKVSCRKNRLTENNSDSLKEQLCSFFYSIRFDEMEAEEFHNINKNLLTTDELAENWRTKFE